MLNTSMYNVIDSAEDVARACRKSMGRTPKRREDREWKKVAQYWEGKRLS